MKINHWGRARKFIREHAEAENSLRAWKRTVIEATWTNFPDVKTTCNSVDWYEGAIIFDIGGNNIRLIAVCRFELGRLYIDKVLTHEEYSSTRGRLDEWNKSQKPSAFCPRVKDSLSPPAPSVSNENG